MTSGCVFTKDEIIEMIEVAKASGAISVSIEIPCSVGVSVSVDQPVQVIANNVGKERVNLHHDRDKNIKGFPIWRIQ